MLCAANKNPLRWKVLEEDRYGLLYLCFMSKWRCFELGDSLDVMITCSQDIQMQGYHVWNKTKCFCWRDRHTPGLEEGRFLHCFAVLLPNTLCIAEPILSCQTASFDWNKLGSPSVKSIPRTRHLHLGTFTLTGAEKFENFCCGSGGSGLHLSFLTSISFINFLISCGMVGQQCGFGFLLFSF